MPARCWRGSIPPSPRPMSARWPPRCPACRRRCPALQAESDGKPFTYSGLDPNLALQAAIFAQRQAEYNFKLENYHAEDQQPGRLPSRKREFRCCRLPRPARRSHSSVEQMRRDLEKLQVGSKLNTLAAMDNRAEMERNLAQRGRNRAQRAARPRGAGRRARWLCAEPGTPTSQRSWPMRSSKLSDAREQLNKAQLAPQLVELRAERDATVLTVAKVSVGSVLQSGQQFITLVPADAPLEVEANISGRDDGFVHVGDPVAIKFDTFPFIQYGMAYGTVRIDQRRQLHRAGRPAQSDRRGAAAARNSSEPFYRARIAIDRVELHDTPRGFRLDARHAGDRRHQGRQADGAAVPARPGPCR